jgi:hypothetical protein
MCILFFDAGDWVMVIWVEAWWVVAVFVAIVAWVECGGNHGDGIG